MSTSEYEVGSYPDNPDDCLLDPAYCVMSDPDPDLMSCLLQQSDYVVLTDDKTGSRLFCGLVVYRIDAVAPIKCLRSSQTADKDPCPFVFLL